MANLFCNINQLNYKIIPALFIGIMALWTSAISAADTAPPSSEKEHLIHITSDLLISDNTSQIIEFKGNVKAVQENTVITANSMMIYYTKNSEKEKNIPASEQSISKIIASGGVHINFDNRVAQADQAVYTVKDRTLVLTGKKVKVTSENNAITGEKITLNRNTGKVIVESNAGRQVKMIVNTDGNGIK